MKNFYRKALTAFVLASVLASSTFAGFMPTPMSPPPPGEMQTPTGTSQTAPGDMHTGLTEAALSLLQGVLPLF